MQMESEILTLTRENGIAVVQLNRPEKDNALSNALRDRIEAAFNECAADPAVKGIVLAAAGTNFCGGYDLEEVIATNLGSFLHRAYEYHSAVYLIEKPVVTAVQGFVLAGGIDLALGGDYIIAGEKTLMGHPEIRFGVPALVTSLARKIGPSRALTLILDGGMIRAKDALELGIINEIVPASKLIEQAIQAATRLSRWAPDAIAIMKRCANELYLGDVGVNLKRELDIFATSINPDGLLSRIQQYYKSV